MANQNNFDNYPNEPGKESPFVFNGSRGDPRYAADRPQGASRPVYPEPRHYGQAAGQAYGDRYAGYGERDYDRRDDRDRTGRYDGYAPRYGERDGRRGYDPYAEPARGYDPYAEPAGRSYDPYGARAPRDPYAEPYPDGRAAYEDPYAEPYGYEGYEGYEEPEQPAEPEPDVPRGYAFKVRNLTKDYDGNVVLNNISFDIPAGKIVGLLGPNG